MRACMLTHACAYGGAMQAALVGACWATTWPMWDARSASSLGSALSLARHALWAASTGCHCGSRRAPFHDRSGSNPVHGPKSMHGSLQGSAAGCVPVHADDWATACHLDLYVMISDDLAQQERQM